MLRTMSLWLIEASRISLPASIEPSVSSAPKYFWIRFTI